MYSYNITRNYTVCWGGIALFDRQRFVDRRPLGRKIKLLFTKNRTELFEKYRELGGQPIH